MKKWKRFRQIARENQQESERSMKLWKDDTEVYCRIIAKKEAEEKRLWGEITRVAIANKEHITTLAADLSKVSGELNEAKETVERMKFTRELRDSAITTLTADLESARGEVERLKGTLRTIEKVASASKIVASDWIVWAIEIGRGTPPEPVTDCNETAEPTYKVGDRVSWATGYVGLAGYRKGAIIALFDDECKIQSDEGSQLILSTNSLTKLPDEHEPPAEPTPEPVKKLRIVGGKLMYGDDEVKAYVCGGDMRVSIGNKSNDSDAASAFSNIKGEWCTYNHTLILANGERIPVEPSMVSIPDWYD